MSSHVALLGSAAEGLLLRTTSTRAAREGRSLRVLAQGQRRPQISQHAFQRDDPRVWEVEMARPRSALCAFGGGSSSQKDYVIMPRHFVLQKGSCYEIRLYDQHAAVSGAHDDAGNSDALLRIQRYLDGENSDRQVLKPREPLVTTFGGSTGASLTLEMCIVPASGQDTLPSSTDTELTIREQPGKVLACFKFSGEATAEAVEQAKNQLLEALREDGIGRRSNVNMKGEYQIAQFCSIADAADLPPPAGTAHTGGSKTMELRVPIKLTLG